MSGFDASMWVTQIVGAAPTLLVMLAGAIFCVTRESRPFRARICVGAALVIHLFSIIVMPLVMQAMMSAMPFSGIDDDSRSIAIRMALMGLVWSSVSAIALGLLLWAVFTRDESSA